MAGEVLEEHQYGRWREMAVVLRGSPELRGSARQLEGVVSSWGSPSQCFNKQAKDFYIQQALRLLRLQKKI